LPAPEAVSRRCTSRSAGSDAYLICELPDNVTAAALALAVNASGLAVSSTVVLLTPAEVDQATKKSIEYRPPGG
jgi:hypothetical protein